MAKVKKVVRKYIQEAQPKVFIKDTPKMGRGVFANTDLVKGEVVNVTPLLKLSPGDLHFIEKTTLQYYVYSSPNDMCGDSYLALGIGSLFNNNSYSANIGYEIDTILNLITFKAEMDVKAGDQLFVNYGWEQ